MHYPQEHFFLYQKVANSSISNLPIIHSGILVQCDLDIFVSLKVNPHVTRSVILPHGFLSNDTSPERERERERTRERERERERERKGNKERTLPIFTPFAFPDQYP